MPTPERTIFRESAIKRYQQRQEQEILLRVAYPPTLIFLCIFLLLLGAGGFACTIQVPILVQGQGVIVEQEMARLPGAEAVAVIFFSPNQLTGLHLGQPAVVSISSTLINLTGSINHLDTTIISPDQAHSRFNLQGGHAQIITEPSITATISIGLATSTRIYVGSLCNAQVQIGSQSVLSSLPSFNQFLGKPKV